VKCIAFGSVIDSLPALHLRFWLSDIGIASGYVKGLVSIAEIVLGDCSQRITHSAFIVFDIDD